MGQAHIDHNASGYIESEPGGTCAKCLKHVSYNLEKKMRSDGKAAFWCNECIKNSNKGKFWSKQEYEAADKEWKDYHRAAAASFYDLSKKSIDLLCHKCSSLIHCSTVKQGDKGTKEVKKGICDVCMSGYTGYISDIILGANSIYGGVGVPEPISWTFIVEGSDDLSMGCYDTDKKYVKGQYMEIIICSNCDNKFCEISWNCGTVRSFQKRKKITKGQYKCWCESCYDEKIVNKINGSIMNDVDSWKHEISDSNNDDKKDDDIETKLNEIQIELNTQNEMLKGIISRNKESEKKLQALNEQGQEIENEIENITTRADIPDVEKKVKDLKRNYQDEHREMVQNEIIIKKATQSLQEQSQLTNEIANNLKQRNDKKAKKAADIVLKIKKMIGKLDQITSVEQDKIVGLKRDCTQCLDDIQSFIENDKRLIDEFRNMQDEFDKTFNKLLREKSQIIQWKKEITQNVVNMNHLLEKVDLKWQTLQ